MEINGSEQASSLRGEAKEKRQTWNTIKPIERVLTACEALERSGSCGQSQR